VQNSLVAYVSEAAISWVPRAIIVRRRNSQNTEDKAGKNQLTLASPSASLFRFPREEMLGLAEPTDEVLDPVLAGGSTSLVSRSSFRSSGNETSNAVSLRRIMSRLGCQMGYGDGGRLGFQFNFPPLKHQYGG
jgi:hypothetical protein